MMKKLTKKQKALYPQFILYIDTNAEGGRVTGKNVISKSMQETDLLSAMRKAEEVINKNFKYIYLVDIYQKTGEENEIGEPYYQKALRTRVHYVDENTCNYSNWHFCDSQHCENDDFSKALWIDYGRNNNGCLEWVG